jgi:shikimate dehydrogenase
LLPYEGLSDKHFLYDLIYNPEETTFLRLGRLSGAKTMNGHSMLILQAEKSWEIWNEH